jgi:hypothetical protein
MASCANSAHIQKAKGTDLSKYKTYSWVVPEKTRGVKYNHKNDIAQQNIRTAVNEALQKKGWQEVQNNPDVLVSSELLVEKSQQEQNDPVYSESHIRTYYNPRTGRYNNFYYPSRFVGYNSYATTVKEGTITILIIDTDTDKTVWQGSATEQLNYAQMTDREINKNVRSIFKKF